MTTLFHSKNENDLLVPLFEYSHGPNLALNYLLGSTVSRATEQWKVDQIQGRRLLLRSGKGSRASVYGHG